MAGAEEGVEGGALDRELTDIQNAMFDAVLEQYRWLAGRVDDGPDRWAILLAVAIVALAITLAILTEGLIHG